MKIVVDSDCPPGRIYFVPLSDDLKQFVVVPTEGDKKKLEETPEKIKEMFMTIKNVGGGG